MKKHSPENTDMLDIQKQYVVDENQRPIAICTAIADFEQIEEILENYGLVKLMEDSDDSEKLTKEEALKYYRSQLTQIQIN